MKQRFKEINFRAPVLLIIEQANTVISRYSTQMTSRQIYYQFIAKKIGLTMKQIRQYNPPPNPAKMTDSRAAAYVEEHGNQSWEVDALDPDVMEEIVRREIVIRRDDRILQEVLKLEEAQKAHWLKVVPPALNRNPGPR